MQRIGILFTVFLFLICSPCFAAEAPQNLRIYSGTVDPAPPVDEDPPVVDNPSPYFDQNFQVARGVSRTSGVAPLSVHFTAGFNASSFADRGFHSYDYTWNFGDPNSGNWGTNGILKNLAKGPVAAHVYETPGTYTATLIIRDETGVVDTDSFSITVGDPDVVYIGTNTTCISDESQNDFTGCPAGATRVATNDISRMVNYVGSGKRVLLHRGSSWTSSGVNFPGNSGPTTIGAYGTCNSTDSSGKCSNAPQINVTSGTFCSLDDKQDWRIQDISLIGSATAGSFGGVDDFQRILFLRLNIDGFNTSIGWSHWNDSTIMTIDQIMIVDSTIIRGSGYVAYVGGERIGLLGNTFADSGSSHLVRIWQAYKSVVSNNRLYGANLSNLNGRHALKFTGPDDVHENPEHCTPTRATSCLENYTSFSVVSDNIIGSSGPWPVMISPQSEVADTKISDIIFERNYIVRDYGTCNYNVTRPLHVVGNYISIRNNIIDGSNAGQDFTAITLRNYNYVPNPTGNVVINNTIYRSDSASDVNVGISISSGCRDTVVRNNLVYYANGTPTTILSNSGQNTANSHNFNIAPAFADPDATEPLSRDFKVESGSVVNGGYTVEVLDDFAGKYRQDGYYDVGAHEK